MSINYDQLRDIEKNLNKFDSAKLQIVTKNRDENTVKELISNGYYLFGENKVQEAKEKFKNLNNPNLELHLIGPLQTNKVKLALSLFDCIQSIDRSKLVNEIAKCNLKTKSKTKNYYIQINIGRETQKSGVYPEDLKDLYNLCIEKKLIVAGLMCIPPFDKQSKDFFNEMKALRNKLNPNLLLSMGMSNDYKDSLECGSNLIRIGSRIFN
tara:strand:+ start:3044 stop:3673 length:630 start_codon:yes stop_codon:yes gene_type:complete